MLQVKLSKPQLEVLTLLAIPGSNLSIYRSSNRADVNGERETYSNGLTHRPILRSTTMATVTKLEDLGLIKSIYEGGHRGMDMVITDKGREIVNNQSR